MTTLTTTATPDTAPKTVKVWDLPVRLCHWGLAACVLANLALTEDGSALHEYVGYAAAGIVAFRLLWGFVGSRHARFADFWPTPSRVMTHLRQMLRGQPEQHLGHNPLGALMMLTLWAVILGLGVTGYLMGTEAYWGNETLEEVHEVLANSLIPLIALHVASALLMSFMSKSKLVRAMITGRKALPDHHAHPAD